MTKEDLNAEPNFNNKYEKAFGEAMNDYHQAYLRESRKVDALQKELAAKDAAISDLQNRFDRDRDKRNKAEEELILVRQELAAKDEQFVAVSKARNHYKALHEDWIKDSWRKEQQIENQVKIIDGKDAEIQRLQSKILNDHETCDKERDALKAENERLKSRTMGDILHPALETMENKIKELEAENARLQTHNSVIDRELAELRTEIELYKKANENLILLNENFKAAPAAPSDLCSAHQEPEKGCGMCFPMLYVPTDEQLERIAEELIVDLTFATMSNICGESEEELRKIHMNITLSKREKEVVIAALKRAGSGGV